MTDTLHHFLLPERYFMCHSNATEIMSVLHLLPAAILMIWCFLIYDHPKIHTEQLLLPHNNATIKRYHRGEFHFPHLLLHIYFFVDIIRQQQRYYHFCAIRIRSILWWLPLMIIIIKSFLHQQNQITLPSCKSD